jgi:hypothetical protein
MNRRGVSQEQVEAIVDRPDCARKAKRPGARKLEKRLSTRRRLAVIIEEADGYVRVVTAYWMR